MRPTKYNEERVEIIAASIAAGDSIKVAAAKAGINLDTFFEWRKSKPEFSDRVKEAKAEYEKWLMEGILKDAQKSLKILINGEEYEETRTEYEEDPSDKEKPRIKKQIVTTKRVLPNPTAVIFALTNRDPENWKNRYSTEQDVKVQGDTETRLSLSKVPDDLLEQVVKAIRGESD